MIYLDHNATTPVRPQVADAMDRAWREGLANPESPHRGGQIARQRLQAARQRIARAWGVAADQLAFLGSGTLANQAVLAAVRRSAQARPVHWIASPVEHPSLLDPLERFAEEGDRVEWLDVDRTGRIDLAQLEQRLRQPADLVVIQAANHETGVLQPLDEIGTICRRHGALWHLDAVQWVGKATVELARTGAAFATISAHKFGGPRGIAVLWTGAQPEQAVELPDFPDWEAAGTEPLELAVGLEVAVAHLTEDTVQHLAQLRGELEAGIEDSFAEAVIHGRTVPRVAQTTSVAFPGIDRQMLLLALDQRGVACAAGSACRSGAAEPSPTLRAMRLDDELIESTIRISLGWTTTRDELARFLEILRDLIPRLPRR